jgi:hypothetical protein
MTRTAQREELHSRRLIFGMLSKNKISAMRETMHRIMRPNGINQNRKVICKQNRFSAEPLTFWTISGCSIHEPPKKKISSWGPGDFFQVQ